MPTYLDHAATTPMRPGAISAMLPFLDGCYANASGSHRFARAARKAVDEARDAVAAALGCLPGEVVFTGSGTEADNAAILGAVRRTGRTAVCPAAEHHAVLHCVEHVGGTVVGVDATGAVDVGGLEEAVAAVQPSVVSVMAVNNEVGTVTPLVEVAAAVRRAAPDALLHTDAVQAACWIDLPPMTALVDAVSLSAHKFGGPKGTGVLVLRDGCQVEPLVLGGGQERDRRSGTLNVAGIVATAVALTETVAEREEECRRVGALANRLAGGLTAVAGVRETVPADRRVPGVVHVCVEGVESEALLFMLDAADVCASAASACSSGAMAPSHVLAAMGVAPDIARGALRLSLGHATTEDDVDRALEAVVGAVARLRRGTVAS
jgi:cysteine desulfurase